MPKHLVRLPRSGGMALDIVSYGRRGPPGTLPLSPEQVEQIKRTVRRVPEVMVKVSGGGRDGGGVMAHLKYIDRHGKLQVETDDGVTLRGRDVADGLVADWQLDLCRSQYKPKPAEGEKDRRAKLVHNIVLSMPAGTPPEAVVAAARVFARENFALQYRYAMVLHTDQAHPHVHLVVKCEHEYEPGRRLYIRKDTLRQWREQFAALMREQGVAANATPRQVRGQVRSSLKDPIHHRLRALRDYAGLSQAHRRGRTVPAISSFMRHKIAEVGGALRGGAWTAEPGKQKQLATRMQAEGDWRATVDALDRQGQSNLAREAEAFAREMPRVRTDREAIAEGLLQAIKQRREKGGGDRSPDQTR